MGDFEACYLNSLIGASSTAAALQRSCGRVEGVDESQWQRFCCLF